MLKLCMRAGVVSLVLSALSAGPMQAQADPASVVKTRQEIMKSLWPDYYKELSQPTDLNAAAAKARQAGEAVRKLKNLFPAGTEREAIPETRATPAVWSARAEFETALDRLAEETEKLGELARAGDAAAARAQFANVAEACGGCHGGPIKSGGKFRYEAK